MQHYIGSSTCCIVRSDCKRISCSTQLINACCCYQTLMQLYRVHSAYALQALSFSPSLLNISFALTFPRKSFLYSFPVPFLSHPCAFVSSSLPSRGFIPVQLFKHKFQILSPCKQHILVCWLLCCTIHRPFFYFIINSISLLNGISFWHDVVRCCQILWSNSEIMHRFFIRGIFGTHDKRAYKNVICNVNSGGI